MGNRAVIRFGHEKDAIGVYLHWNGGTESVKAFLDFMAECEVRSDDYGVARLAQAIGNFFGGTLSVGIGLASRLDQDNGDNGTYVIQDWEVVERLFVEPHVLSAPFRDEYYEGVLAEVRAANAAVFSRGR